MALAQVVSLFDVLPEQGQTFIQFWYVYPKRVGKVEAQRAWARLSPAQRKAAAEALPAHVAHWQLSGTERRFIPHPSTWLNGRRWEDELQELDAPLQDLGRCEWNANGTREPGRGRCESRAKHTVITGSGAPHCYCEAHAPRVNGTISRR